MLELLNAKERDTEDWKALFKSAGKYFQFIGISRPKESKLSFIEVLWRGADID